MDPESAREDHLRASPLQETWQTHLQEPPPARSPTEIFFKGTARSWLCHLDIYIYIYIDIYILATRTS